MYDVFNGETVIGDAALSKSFRNILFRWFCRSYTHLIHVYRIIEMAKTYTYLSYVHFLSIRWLEQMKIITIM